MSNSAARRYRRLDEADRRLVHPPPSRQQVTCTMRTQFLAALCAVLLAGCGSLPFPHKTADSSPAVRVEGTRGPLSIHQSERVLASKNGNAETNIFTKHLAEVEDISESPLVAGNKVTLLVAAHSPFLARQQRIKGIELQHVPSGIDERPEEFFWRICGALILR